MDTTPQTKQSTVKEKRPCDLGTGDNLNLEQVISTGRFQLSLFPFQLLAERVDRFSGLVQILAAFGCP